MMGKYKRQQPQERKRKPSVGQSVTIYGAFVYKTLDFFGVKGTDILEWIDTLPSLLLRIWDTIQKVF